MRIRQQDNGSQADYVIITLSKQKCLFKNTLGNFLSKNKKKCCEHQLTLAGLPSMLVYQARPVTSHRAKPGSHIEPKQKILKVRNSKIH